MEKNLEKLARALTDEFIAFVNKSVSPFHAVHEVKTRLNNSKFLELHENENWKLEKGGKYFFTRNKSTIIAFTVGNNFDPNNTGFKIIGAHTDSPFLRLAPISKSSSQDFVQASITTYGGGLWHTWFDRDLTLGGRVVFRNQKNQGQFESDLFYYPKALCKIPNLAIHLTPQEDRGKFAPNTETHLKPIIAHELFQQLTGIKYQAPKQEENTQNQQKQSGNWQTQNHYYGLLQLISQQLNVNVEDIVDLDLYFSDVQPACYFGLNDEFLSSPRLDNLFSSFFALKSITSDESFQQNSSFINMICLFDHEECGSESFQGAGSNLLAITTERIFKILTAGLQNVQVDAEHKMYNNSFLISADMAHGIHPNYTDKHKANYQVKLNGGPVIKTNHNQRYATDAVSAGILRIIAEKNQVPIQDFIVKNDMACGTTIGPILSPKAGVKTVDIGVGQLGMHSIRETCGVIDGYYYERLFTGFFKDYENLKHDLLKY